ncbi:Rho GTPase-activating protein 100F like protein [Argiope bruennichi]|uniref:Rho GTPase-activating protein 100F like protein n=1 Tax=Argiope bruennichi TaxID=94029 RepID=A0A8T0EMY2_ARGBR|nr:Rho GTPase-activating protein 100F like protein [Argiope bruennichi]
MNSFANRPRLRRKVKHILFSTMLCCGKRKDARGDTVETMTEAGGGVVRRLRPPQHGIVVQRDFRKVSGISNEIFRQIEAVENDFDAATAAHVDAVENRGGEMLIRIFDPCSLGRVGADTYRKYLSAADASHIVRFVEIIKRPGQTLGLYIREGDGIRETEGVFISRIALESAVYNSGVLRVGDEILAVNLVDVRHMSLDDVVIIMSIPRRLVLTIRSRISAGGSRVRELTRRPPEGRPPVVVIKKETTDDRSNEENSENGHLIRARTKGLPPEIPAIAVKLSERDHQRERHRYEQPTKHQTPPEDLYYNSQPPSSSLHRPPAKIPHHHHPYHQPPPSHEQYTASRRRKEPLPSQPRWVVPPPVTDQPTKAAPHYKTTPLPPESSYYPDERATKVVETYEQTQPERFYPPHHRRTRSMVPPTRGGYDIEVAAAPLRRSTGMLSDYHHHRGYQQRGGRGGILRRRGGEESASDTEVQEFWTMGSSRRSYYSGAGRSNSLPRSLRSGYGRHQAVRFTTSLPYDSQEESDGAVSAPELPATRSMRRPHPQGSRRSPSVFTSNEYKAWMSRAPSTSAIYERLRRGNHANNLGRIAYSAESLLDTMRQEEHRGIYTFPRRLHTPSEDSLPAGGAYAPRMTVPHPTPIKSSEERLHLVSLDPRDFNKYRPRATITPVSVGPREPTQAPRGYSGLLWIHLLSGRGLKPTGHSDHFRDLYCVIECDRVHKARTVIRTGEHSFDWDEIFEIDLVENREVAFLLYTWDPRFRHKLCYKGTLHLSALLRESPVHSLALKLEPRGTLYLKLRFKNPTQTFQRMPAASEGALFGVDLERVLVREDSGYGVPLIVKRCTEEVERRGLDIVGIYRLCGSALRKRLLREDFERNSLMANLSVEHVPDINVVTSLLKDYLRELPEPLLSKSLYDMLVDGLSVCLPDDPDGSAKLMFSILECLPKANLCTVLLLLDHLRLIASHCDRNKMTPQGLAMAFGPVLMCHAETPTATVDIRRPIDIMNFLVEMWPNKRTSWSSSSSSWDSSVLSELLESLDGAWLGHRLLPESLVDHVPY